MLVVPGFWIVAGNPAVNGAVLAVVLIMIGGSVETAIVAMRARRLHGDLMATTDREAAAGLPTNGGDG